MPVTPLDAPPEGAIIRARDPRGPRFLCALDLGQAADYTALAVIERVPVPTGRVLDRGARELVLRASQGPTVVSVVEPETSTALHVRYLHRYPLNTDYVAMAGQVGKLVLTLPVEPAKPVLVLDHTGVGRGVFDVFRHARLGLPLLGITITGGQEARQDPDRPWEWTVPKKDLVGALQVAVQADRLKIAPALDLARTLAEELQGFRMRIGASGHATYEAWREQEKDDLVLAVAMGCWMSEHLDRRAGG